MPTETQTSILDRVNQALVTVGGPDQSRFDSMAMRGVTMSQLRCMAPVLSSAESRMFDSIIERRYDGFFATDDFLCGNPPQQYHQTIRNSLLEKGCLQRLTSNDDRRIEHYRPTAMGMAAWNNFDRLG